MKFTRLGKNEIRCVLSEEELVSFGIDLDDILEKNVKSGKFFNEILSRAVQALGEQSAEEIRGCSAQISILKDRSISILFHTRKNDILTEFADKLKEAGEKLREAAALLPEKEDNSSFIVSFKTLDDAAAFCRAGRTAGHLISRLSKSRKNNEYLLFIFRYACDEREYRKVRLLADEFGRVTESAAASKAYLLENSDMLISDDAFYTLGEV
ncbi:MAG: adaptor protein MecA [Lachnospiraceae bacterium]|nr:adaptor protein MecA [Lachnospiraceae bacterium]